ncbi:CPBP family glutamic-type intramembrane protease, partial [Candidatus Bathyarchaeota archaeon]|nr:CPBP family glutamic-type intramembrane protease [Candidatus Bathyarchaeota archaeon]
SVFMQLAMVANSEETLKLSMSNVLDIGIGKKMLGKILATVVPIAVWAILHAYVSYTGALVPILILSAFAAGLIIWFVEWKTQSVLCAILVHAFYNCFVVLMTMFSG